MSAKDLIPKKKGCKKTGGRKKGVPNKVTREIRDIFERLCGFITDEDLYSMYKKFKRKPELFIKFLNIIAPKNLHILFKGNMNISKIDLTKLTEDELKKYMELTQKIENTKPVNTL